MEFSKKLHSMIGSRQAGQSLAEYGLIISLVAVVSIAGLNVLGNSVSGQLSKIATSLSTVAVAGAPGGGGGGPTGGSSPSSGNMPMTIPPPPTTPPNATAPPPPPPANNSPPAPANNPPPPTAPPSGPVATVPSTGTTDSQQGAGLICNGNDPSCGGNVDVGSQYGW